jgi:alkylated DNA repair protein (DNA oxidative demethylase)
LKLFKGFLDRQTQVEIIEACREIARKAPLITFTTKSGHPFRMQSTSAGKLGWLSDKGGYRYAEKHPVTNQPWPEIPELLVRLSKQAAALVGEHDYRPETCLINFYPKGGRLGLHRDNSEINLKPAIISFSLGDSATFLIEDRNKKIHEIQLDSGDLLILHGKSRLARHGIKKIHAGTSDLLRHGGRLNLTIRQIH